MNTKILNKCVNILSKQFLVTVQVQNIIKNLRNKNTDLTYEDYRNLIATSIPKRGIYLSKSDKESFDNLTMQLNQAVPLLDIYELSDEKVERYQDFLRMENILSKLFLRSANVKKTLDNLHDNITCGKTISALEYKELVKQSLNNRCMYLTESDYDFVFNLITILSENVMISLISVSHDSQLDLFKLENILILHGHFDSVKIEFGEFYNRCPSKSDYYNLVQKATSNFKVKLLESQYDFVMNLITDLNQGVPINFRSLVEFDSFQNTDIPEYSNEWHDNDIIILD